MFKHNRHRCFATTGHMGSPEDMANLESVLEILNDQDLSFIEILIDHESWKSPAVVRHLKNVMGLEGIEARRSYATDLRLRIATGLGLDRANSAPI